MWAFIFGYSGNLRRSEREKQQNFLHRKMSRSRAIDTRLEKLVPSVEEYIVTGVFTRAEVKDLNRKRTDCEYRLVAKPLLLIDVRQAIALEMSVEQKIAAYCASSKVVLKHRWAVQERVEQIYKIGLKHIRHPEEYESLRRDFVAFLTTFKRAASLSQHYADLVVKNPLRAAYWVEAALWQSDVGEVDNARTSVQHAISLLPSSEDVYVCALTIELQFANKLFNAMVKEHQERLEAAKSNSGPPAGDMVERLKSENASLAVVALELGLCRIVVQDCLERDAAATPSLVCRLYEAALKYPFAKSFASFVLTEALHKRLLPALREGAEGQERRRWQSRWLTAEASQVICSLASHELSCCSGLNARYPVVQVETYLKDALRGLKKRKQTSPVELRSALMKSISTCIGFLFASWWTPCAVTSRQLFELVYEPLQAKLGSLLGCTASRMGKVDVDHQEMLLEQTVQSDVLTTVIAFVCDTSKTRWAQFPCEDVAERLGVEAAGWTSEVIAAAFSLCEGDTHTPTQTTHKQLSALPCAKPATWSIPVALKLLTPGDLMRIGLAGPAFADHSNVPKKVVDVDAVDDHLVQQLVQLESSNEGVPAALLALLSSAGLVPTECQSTLRITRKCPLWTDPSLPTAAWKLWFVAELARPTTISSLECNTTGSSSDSDDDDGGDGRPTKRPRREPHGTLPDAFLGSFGAIGMILAGRSSRAYATLSGDDALHRCLGFVRLTYVTLVNILGISAWTREAIADKLASLRPTEAERVVSVVNQMFGFVCSCPPLPRQILSSMLIPFKEAVVLSAAPSPAARDVAVREARNAHEKLIAHYRLAHASSDERSPLTNAVFRLGRDTPPLNKHVHEAYTGMSTAELNSRDWVSFVQFERHVAKDLSSSVKVANRARQDAVDPRLVVVMLASSQ